MSRIITRNWLDPTLVCVLGFLVAACAPVEPTLSAPTVNAQVPITTIRATNTAVLPTSEATPLPTNSLTPESATVPPTTSPTPINTPTTQPTPIPFPSATPLFPESFSFPDWVSDPQSTVLLVSFRDRNDDGALYMINASTGEQFETFSPSEGFWHSDWLQTDNGLNFIINKTSGDTTTARRFLHQVDLYTGEERVLPLGDFYGEGLFSPDRMFTAKVIGETGTESVVIIDHETGQEIMLADPFNGRFSDRIDMSWSADSALLSAEFNDFGGNGLREPSLGSAIFTTDGRIYRTYYDTRNWAWAPDGSYRLLTNEGDFWDNGEPCILDIETNVKDCLSEVTGWRENGIEKTGYYQWLPDGSGISFLYWDRTDERQAGLCIIDISSRDITCPVNETHIFSAAIGPEVGGFTYLVDYKWSPDGRYIALEIDPCGPECDDRTLTQVATIARDGSQFYLWGFGGLWDASWRPPLETIN